MDGLYGIAGVEGEELDVGVLKPFDLIVPTESTVELMEK
jgi:hypothetical protein